MTEKIHTHNNLKAGNPMETLVPTGDNEEPKPERTETEKIAQYRVDYRASLKSVVDTLSTKVNYRASLKSVADVLAAKVTRDILVTKMARPE
jgi:hypothetical protein